MSVFLLFLLHRHLFSVVELSSWCLAEPCRRASQHGTLHGSLCESSVVTWAGWGASQSTPAMTGLPLAQGTGPSRYIGGDQLPWLYIISANWCSVNCILPFFSAVTLCVFSISVTLMWTQTPPKICLRTLPSSLPRESLLCRNGLLQRPMYMYAYHPQFSKLGTSVVLAAFCNFHRLEVPEQILGGNSP